MARNEKIYLALYPDGRKNLEVRIGLNADQVARAQRSHGSSVAIENARKGICMQVKARIRKEYSVAPRWIEWERLTLKEVADNQPPPSPPPPPEDPTLF